MYTHNVLIDKIKACDRRECPLHPTHGNAMQVVPGCGNINAKIMIVGEAPGADEDVAGKPFVGAAGKVLDSLLSEIGIDRETIYITNICKCRPPNNRNPLHEEMNNCSLWLDKEINLIKPKIIITLGNIPKDRLVPAMPGITKCHGMIAERWLKDDTAKSIPLHAVNNIDVLDMRAAKYMFLYHPSYIIRQGGINSKVYNDTVIDLEKLIDLYEEWRMK